MLDSLEVGPGQVAARRPHEHVEEVLDHADLEIRTAWGSIGEAATHREHRIAEQACLDHLGLGHPEVLVGRLDRTVLEQGDLNGGIHRERVSQKLLDGLVEIVVRLIAAPPLDALLDAVPGQALHVLESALDRW